MLLMRHDITFAYDNNQRKECITAIMIDYGIPNGDSSMARTVSLPAAIGVRMLLEGRIKLSGVHTPVIAEVYDPVLEELEPVTDQGAVAGSRAGLGLAGQITSRAPQVYQAIDDRRLTI